MGNIQGTHITGDGHQQLQFLLFHKLASDPTVAHEAQFYYNTVDKAVRIYDTSVVDSTWNYFPKIEGAFTTQQVLAGDGFFIKPIVAPAGVHFLLVDSNATPSFINLTSIFTDNILNYDSTLHTYRAYASKKGADPTYAYFYSGSTTPTFTNRINLDGKLYATAYNIAGGTPSKYYGTDASNNLVPMTDPLTAADQYWKRVSTTLSPLIDNYLLDVRSTSSTATITGIGTIGTGVYGSSTSAPGVQGNSSSGYGVYGLSASAVGGFFKRTASSTNSVLEVLHIQRLSNSVGAGGIGGFIGFSSLSSTSAIRNTGKIVNTLTTATNTVEISSFEWWLLNGGTLAKKMELTGAGQLALSNYGSGTFTGTATKTLQVTSTGNVIEGPAGGYWQRVSTTLSPLTNEDKVRITSTGTNNGYTEIDGNRITFFEAANSGDAYIRMDDDSVLVINSTSGNSIFIGDYDNNSGGIYMEISTMLSMNCGINTKRGDYHYHAQSISADTAGDWRTYGNGTAFYTEYCTVGNSTKGAGTWVVKQTITI